MQIEKAKICLLGDSNLCQHAFPETETARKFLGAAEVQIMRATVLGAYRAAFEEVNQCNVLVVSALLNHVADLEKNWNDVDIDENKANEITNVLEDTAKILNDFSEKNPRVRILVVPPIYRTAPKWLHDSLPLIKESFPNLIGSDICYLNEFEFNVEELKSDGVHLRDRAIGRFKQYIKDNIIRYISDGQTTSRKRLRTETDQVEDDVSGMSDRQINLRNNRLLEEISSKLFKTDDKVKEIDSRVESLFSSHVVNSARMSERMDGLENKTRRNLVVIRGLKIDPSIPIPSSIRERANFIHAYLTQELSKITQVIRQGFSVKSIFLIPTGVLPGTIQDIRATCASMDDAQEVKMRILKAKEAGIAVWKEAEVSNDPMKATRVRISLMQAISRQINRDGNQEAMVAKYLDNPTLTIKSGGRLIKNLSFVDSILQYGAKLSKEDLDKAYKIAGTSFKGQMEVNFLVLKEVETEITIPTPAGTYIPPTRGNFRGSFRGRGLGRGNNRYRWQNMNNPNLIPLGQANQTNSANNVGITNMSYYGPPNQANQQQAMFNARQATQDGITQQAIQQQNEIQTTLAHQIQPVQPSQQLYMNSSNQGIRGQPIQMHPNINNPNQTINQSSTTQVNPYYSQ